MTSYLDKLIEDDLVSTAVYEALMLREHRLTRTGYTTICCPMCVRRGTTPDRKFRCGIKSSDGLGVNCFNCAFKAKFRIGQRLSYLMRDFLTELGISPRDILTLARWADMISSMIEERPDIQIERTFSLPSFYADDLPEKARSLQEWIEMGYNDPDFLATVDYLLSRGDTVAKATTYYWSPEMRQRLIIPCYHQHTLVGWTARIISNETDEPKYLKQLPNNYLFNTKFLTIPERKYVFIVEGVFDALAVDGIAALGATLNATQINWIEQFDKQPVVIPDRDKSGKHLIDIATKNKWLVSAMWHREWWDDDVKDCAEATMRYGKLYVIRSIIANLTNVEAKIYERTYLQRT